MKDYSKLAAQSSPRTQSTSLSADTDQCAIDFLNFLKSVSVLNSTPVEQLDCTWVCGQQSSRLVSLSDMLELCIIRQESEAATDAARKVLLEYTDEDLLRGYRLVAETWLRKQARVNTKSIYQQQKCDLIAQNLEGFAFLMASIDNLVSFNDAVLNFDSARSVSGAFELQTLRVLDAVLMCLHGFHLDSDAVLTFNYLDSFTSLAELLGFRLYRFSKALKTLTTTQLVFETMRRALMVETIHLYTLYPYFSADECLLHSQMSLPISHPDTLEMIELKILFLDKMQRHADHTQMQTALERLTKLGIPVCSRSTLRALPITLVKRELDKDCVNINSDSIRRFTCILGPHVCHDVSLTADLLKCFNHKLTFSKLDNEYAEQMIATCFIPGLSLMKPNPMISNLVWEILSKFPFTKRSKIYKYASDVCSKVESLVDSQPIADRCVQRVLRRLSRLNVKDLGRKLGKISSRYPFATTRAVLNQIQVYPNMIEPLVEACKYWNCIAFDILMHEIIIRFSQNSAKLKEDGQHVSLWFSALSSFCGALHKKYPNIELSALLEYILNTLKSGQSLDFLILKDLVFSLSGIEILKDMNFAEIVSPALGENLKRAHKICDGKEWIKSRARLRKALEQTENSRNITIPMLVMLATYRRRTIFDAKSCQLKLISQLYDESHSVFLQYVMFLQQAFSNCEYTELFPNIGVLFQDFKLEPAIVFHIYRPILRRMQSAPAVEDANRTTWRCILSEVRTSLPSKLWSQISPELYLTFWTLNLGDLFIPSDIYATEIIRTQRQLNLAPLTVQVEGTACATSTIQGVTNKVLELQQELNSLEDKVRNTIDGLVASKHEWVTGEAQSLSICDILVNCIFPRCKISRVDALYASTFMKLMNDAHVPMFSSLQYYDKLFRDAVHMMYSCSEIESKCFGIFMLDTLQQLSRWRCAEIYEKECWNFREITGTFDSKMYEKPIFTAFIKISYKWEHRLAKGILNRLSNNDYMEINNSLNLLILVVKEFPRSSHLVAHIYKRIKRIQATEVRSDIKTVATRYLAMLSIASQKWASESPTS